MKEVFLARITRIAQLPPVYGKAVRAAAGLRTGQYSSCYAQPLENSILNLGFQYEHPEGDLL